MATGVMVFAIIKGITEEHTSFDDSVNRWMHTGFICYQCQLIDGFHQLWGLDLNIFMRRYFALLTQQRFRLNLIGRVALVGP